MSQPTLPPVLIFRQKPYTNNHYIIIILFRILSSKWPILTNFSTCLKILPKDLETGQDINMNWQILTEVSNDANHSDCTAYIREKFSIIFSQVKTFHSVLDSDLKCVKCAMKFGITKLPAVIPRNIITSSNCTEHSTGVVSLPKAGPITESCRWCAFLRRFNRFWEIHWR